MAAKTLYELLEVSSNASPDAIRAAYERLIPKLDPDRPENVSKPDARIHHDTVKEAFLTLSNPAKRAQYDKTLAARSQPAIYNVEVIEPFWTLPKLIVVALIVVVGGGYYYSDKQTQAKLETEKAIATAKAKEAEENAKAEAAQARIDAQLARDQALMDARQRREHDAALRGFQQEQSMNQRTEQGRAQRERAEQQRAEAQQRREESQAVAAARQQAARDKAELCRIERERYGRAISC
jgi:curved DNA-binding protein CbpA